jgi:hypothetical protein
MLISWIQSLDDAKYSFVKEFFAAIDDAKFGWPLPFNYQAVPLTLRLLEKYWVSEHEAEFVEALYFRYQALASEQGDEGVSDPASIQDLMLLANTHLDMQI